MATPSSFLGEEVDKRTRALVVSAVSIIALGGAAGCGTRVQASTALPELGPIPAIDSYDDFAFPLDSYHLTQAQQNNLNQAAEILTSACMKTFGFDHVVAGPTTIELRDRAIGVVSAEEVAVHGYRNRASERAAAERDAMKRKTDPHGGAAAGVLAGNGQTQYGGKAVPQGGCVGEAHRQLGVDRASADPGTTNFVLALEARSTDLAEADNRLRTAFGHWQDCMIEAGYHYTTPWGPNDDPAFRTEDVTEAEIATAKADVACRDKHNVNGIWVAVRTAYQEQLIAEHSAGLAKHREIRDRQLAQANEVITSTK